MADDTIFDKWPEAKTPRERLIWARRAWQVRAGAVNGNATDAALSLGMKPGTYSGYERPEDSSRHTKLTHQRAIQFGRKYRVSWRWMLTGEGTPSDDQLPDLQARVVEAMSQIDEDEQRVVAAMVEAMARKRA